MLRYEVLILVTPDVTQDEAASLEKHIAALVKNAKADLISYERWGKYRLAYPVNGKEYGVYYLVRFAAAADQKTELIVHIKDALQVKFNTIVMRHMIHQLGNSQSLEYSRPQSLEEIPQDADSFLKDNPALMSRQHAAKDVVEEVDHGQEN